MMFRDRRHAGKLLAARLSSYRDDAEAVVLALPRGGVAVGYELSTGLRLPLDVFITRKIGLPGFPEYAIGAITESGHLYVNPEAAASLHLTREGLEALARDERREIVRRATLYRQGRPLCAVRDRTVMLVDDGIATGSTFFATIEALRQLKPARLIAAIPVAPESGAEQVRACVDECVILATPVSFDAVGRFYGSFGQVDDDTVIQLLAAAAEAQARSADERGRKARVP